MELPSYQRVFESLKQRIRSGDFGCLEMLPPEPKLMEEYEVSRGTLRRALDELRRLGLIDPQPGRGTLVIKTPPMGRKTLYYEVAAGTLDFDSKLAAAWRQRHPEVEVRIVGAGWRAILGGGSRARLEGGPCVTQVPGENSSLVPLEGLPGFQELLGLLHPQVQKAVHTESQGQPVCALPVFCGTRLLVADARLLEACGLSSSYPPRTWAELLELLDLLSRKAEGRFAATQVVLAASTALGHFLSFFLGASGGEPLVAYAGGQARLAVPAAIETVRLFQEILRRGFSEPLDETARDLFLDGRVALNLAAGVWILKEAAERAPGRVLRAAPIPVLRAGDEPRTQLGLRHAAILADSLRSQEDLDLCWDFLRGLLSREGQWAAAHGGIALPCRRDVCGEWALENPAAWPFLEALASAVPDGPGLRPTAVRELFKAHLRKALRGELTAEAAMMQAGEAIGVVLAGKDIAAEAWA